MNARLRFPARASARVAIAIATALAAAAAASCAGSGGRSEGLDPSTLPSNVRADYAVFAHRCSKCHSLARPLNSGISDDGYWAMYVARMRRQPGSGISHDDAVAILRFLHYYSLEQQRKKPAHGASSHATLGRGAL
jgi:hypothetical protein